MSIEEIIEGVSAVAKNELTRCHGLPTGMSVYLYEAIELLRTHPDAQSNEPLTLEALQGMQAKPGWLDCQYEKGWGIISVSEFGRMISITTLNDTYFIYANGEYNDLLGAEIYLRPPKEGEL